MEPRSDGVCHSMETTESNPLVYSLRFIPLNQLYALRQGKICEGLRNSNQSLIVKISRIIMVNQTDALIISLGYSRLLQLLKMRSRRIMTCELRKVFNCFVDHNLCYRFKRFLTKTLVTPITWVSKTQQPFDLAIKRSIIKV